ncbi:galectin-3b [Aulostomus maculatus]
MEFDLSGALDSNQPEAPQWPGQPSSNPIWGGQSGVEGMWSGSGGGGPWAGGSFPTPQPPGPGSGYNPSAGPTKPVAPQYNLTVPYNQTLPRGVYDKLIITINGTIKPNADKIIVDLGTSSDLAFHFNPRFNENSKSVIVRNSRIGNKWGTEERNLKNFPFVLGQPFELKILCTSTEFRVAVNNSHLLEFKHRIHDLRSIIKLAIYNDLTLSSINIDTLP